MNDLWFIFLVVAVTGANVAVFIATVRKYADSKKLTIDLTTNFLKINNLTKMTVNGTNTQNANFILNFTNRLGGEAQVEPGSVTVEASDTSIAVVGDPNASNPPAFTIEMLETGTPYITIKADADLGEGVETIEAQVNFDIAPANAVGINPNVELTERTIE